MHNTRSWLISFALLVVFVALSYTFFDLRIAEYFHQLKGTPPIDAASVLTHAGVGGYYIVPSLLLFLYFRKRNPDYGKIALFIFATTAASGIIVNILKTIFGRFRPKMYFNEQLYGFDWFHTASTMVSFPSGHSATAMGAWFAFALILPKYRFLFLAIGASIAFTRIALTAHYLSDVVAGSYLGVVITLICYHLIFVKNPKERA